MGIKDWLLGNPSPGRSYEVTVRCMNCDHTVTVRIGHGKSVERWAKDAKCRICKTRGNFQKY